MLVFTLDLLLSGSPACHPARGSSSLIESVRELRVDSVRPRSQCCCAELGASKAIAEKLCGGPVI